jgi:hypothetical protein
VDVLRRDLNWCKGTEEQVRQEFQPQIEAATLRRLEVNSFEELIEKYLEGLKDKYRKQNLTEQDVGVHAIAELVEIYYRTEKLVKEELFTEKIEATIYQRLFGMKVKILGLAESEKERLGEKTFNELNFFLFQLELNEWLNEQGVSRADDEESFQQRKALIDRYIAEHPEAQRVVAPFKAKLKELGINA